MAITEAGGCLQCQIGRTGAPSFKVVDWPEGADANQEEPACGAHYQPYGPIELSYVTAMLSELALDCLLQPPEHSFSRVFVTSENRIANLGGRLSELWKSTYGEENTGVRIVDLGCERNVPRVEARGRTKRLRLEAPVASCAQPSRLSDGAGAHPPLCSREKYGES
ncbi:hypothetical protein ABIC03_005212 [Bradyrhizobium sp. RT6a]